VADVTRRFSERVDDYVRHRPGYPDEVINVLEREVGLQPDWRIADVGSGSGISSRIFLENANTVVAVEPNREMREAAERWLAGYPGFQSVDGRAEATALADSSVDLIVVAQAFHWFDLAAARSEFHRILQPPRWVALLWNTRDHDASDFMRAYEQVVLRFGTDYEQVRHDRTQDDRIRNFLSAGYSRTILTNEQMLDLEGLQGRARSSSYMPGLGQPNFEPMLKALQELFATFEQGGTVRFEYVLEVFTGKLEQG
jgi:SAM-dependent methyltransferase